MFTVRGWAAGGVVGDGSVCVSVCVGGGGARNSQPLISTHLSGIQLVI